MSSILSYSIISTVGSKGARIMMIGVSSFACSSGCSECYPYSKVGDCCLGLKTSKISILSFLS